MLKKAQQIKSQLIEWRRDFHMHPEMGFQEVRTAGIVADHLTQLGCRVRTGVGKTGVVAELGEGKPVIAIRADMDALPVNEANDVPYKSKNPGYMHACGHDAHTAILMGVATLLSEEHLKGTVRFIFQPSEEVEDEEGISGAPRMVADGAIDGVDCVIALHVYSGVKTGTIELAHGNTAAGVDTFYGTVKGKGGHGSTPHKVVDPIFLSGYVILALHGIVSRRLPPYAPAVVSIGSIQGGHIDNVIPRTVKMSGTIRYLDPKIQKTIHTEVERAFKVAKTMGGDYDMRIQIGYPPITNHPKAVNLIQRVATEMIGPSKIKEPDPEMGAEDFGYFMQKIPGAMFYLGCRIEGDERRHHDVRFDIDEDCLPIGAALLAQTAISYLEKGFKD